MRAVQVSRFGGPDVLETSELPEPVAGPGQVVVDVSVVDILFLDTQLRGGWGKEWFGSQPPYVPGTGVAGRVVAVGEEVDPAWIGRRVTAAPENGAYSERAVAAVESLTAVPDGLGLREAAALVQAGPAALGLVDAAEIKPGERVLVTAAAGGLGTLLVQLARTAGATVVAAARGTRKLDLAAELGAQVAVDYSEAGWTGEGGFDVVFDGVGGQIGTDAFAATRAGGRFFAYGIPSGEFADIAPEEAERRGVRLTGIEQVQFAPADAQRLVERTLREAAAGRVRAVIGQTFPLERAADAHAAIESREVLGRTLLLVEKR